MSKFDVERLNQLPILEVANKLGLKLDRSNKCHCFIHEEKTPSFSINKRKNTWKCFGCGEGGNIIELVKRYRNCNFDEACKWLSNEFGIVKYNVTTIKRDIKIKTITDIEPNPEIYKWFFDNLSVTDNARKFIMERKYPESTIIQYNLKGLDNCKAFFDKLKAKWGLPHLLKCGLAKETVDKSTGEILHKFTWWTKTLFFPFYDKEGNIIYIQGRSLNFKTNKTPKYVNLSGVNTTLFNQPILNSLKKNDNLVITEGVTDCISCCLMGKNAVGVIGAHGFKEEYVNLLKNFKIIVIPDNDKNKTGDEFADKIREKFLLIGKTIDVFPLGEAYKDISEYYINAWKHE